MSQFKIVELLSKPENRLGMSAIQIMHYLGVKNCYHQLKKMVKDGILVSEYRDVGKSGKLMFWRINADSDWFDNDEEWIYS